MIIVPAIIIFILIILLLLVVELYVKTIREDFEKDYYKNS